MNSGVRPSGVFVLEFVQQAASNANDYAAFMGDFPGYRNCADILMLVGTNIVRIFGWFAALLSLIMLLITSNIFSSILFTEMISGITALVAARFDDGSDGRIACKSIYSGSSKNALVDSTKEMAYIPLDDELEVKEAAVDGLAGG